MSYATLAAQGKYHDVRIEAKGHGATYAYTEGFNVYGFVTNGPSSVLAGTDSRCWLGHYESLEAAQADFPMAMTTDCSSHIAQEPSRPAWCTPQYEAENGEMWESH